MTIYEKYIAKEPWRPWFEPWWLSMRPWLPGNPVYRQIKDRESAYDIYEGPLTGWKRMLKPFEMYNGNKIQYLYDIAAYGPVIILPQIHELPAAPGTTSLRDQVIYFINTCDVSNLPLYTAGLNGAYNQLVGTHKDEEVLGWSPDSGNMDPLGPRGEKT